MARGPTSDGAALSDAQRQANYATRHKDAAAKQKLGYDRTKVGLKWPKPADLPADLALSWLNTCRILPVDAPESLTGEVASLARLHHHMVRLEKRREEGIDDPKWRRDYLAAITKYNTALRLILRAIKDAPQNSASNKVGNDVKGYIV